MQDIVNVGDRVEAGEHGTEAYDTGRVFELRELYDQYGRVERREARVGWDSGVVTWIDYNALRAL